MDWSAHHQVRLADPPLGRLGELRSDWRELGVIAQRLARVDPIDYGIPLSSG